MYSDIGHRRAGGQLEPRGQSSTSGERCCLLYEPRVMSSPSGMDRVTETYDGMDQVIVWIDGSKGDIP